MIQYEKYHIRRKISRYQLPIYGLTTLSVEIKCWIATHRIDSVGLNSGTMDIKLILIENFITKNDHLEKASSYI